MERADDLSIGALARETGVKVPTIRYYEKIGLLPAPPRSAGGHRLYSPAHVRRLHFIRRTRELGFSLDEVTTLLGLSDGGDFSCIEVRDVTCEHLEAVRAKIADLKTLEAALADLAERCEKDTGPDCPILNALFSESPVPS